MLFKNSVRTSKRTPHFTITKINWLTLFKEIIAVYNKSHEAHKYTLREKCKVTERQSRWYIYLPFELQRLMFNFWMVLYYITHFVHIHGRIFTIFCLLTLTLCGCLPVFTLIPLRMKSVRRGFTTRAFP